MLIVANFVDIRNKTIFPAEIQVENGKIKAISSTQKRCERYILPGFIDAHIHIESSMLVPSEFAKIAVTHGTVATVSDPHEIANVMGVEGVEYMIDNSRLVPLKFFFGAPSCVPATEYETAGAIINAAEIQQLLMRDDVKYLAEMMNYPGVIHEAPEVMKKIQIANRINKPIDGHAPGLRGDELKKYHAAGISTDHECFTFEEAKEKLKLGMKVIIREGSAAKNFDALVNLIPKFANQMMFCSDDKHPDDLLEGHINLLVKRALKNGMDLFDVLQMACINPIEHYQLDVGSLRLGEPADFILVNNLVEFKIEETYIEGNQVFTDQKISFNPPQAIPINNFNVSLQQVSDFGISLKKGKLRVIQVHDGELITSEIEHELHQNYNNFQSSVDSDILKIVVVNRYKDVPPAIGLIRGFGLIEGAIASCVAHDSHNIIAVGVDDQSICNAINLIIKNRGGISLSNSEIDKVLPLPVAGIMSNKNAEFVGKAYADIDVSAKAMGSPLSAPYMTLSFMGLLVIPQLKLSDLGLFDGSSFQFTNLQKNESEAS